MSFGIFCKITINSEYNQVFSRFFLQITIKRPRRMPVHNIGTFACYGQKILILVHLFEFLSIFCTKFSNFVAYLNSYAEKE